MHMKVKLHLWLCTDCYQSQKDFSSGGIALLLSNPNHTPSPACLTTWPHYNDVIMGAIASQITSLTIVFSAVYSDADPRQHQSSASLAFVRGIHRGPVNSPHKWHLRGKCFHLMTSSWAMREQRPGSDTWAVYLMYACTICLRTGPRLNIRWEVVLQDLVKSMPLNSYLEVSDRSEI